MYLDQQSHYDEEKIIQYKNEIISLDISYNKLKKIPDIIFELKNLEILKISCNEIENIPKYIYKLTNLKKLYIYRNKLNEILFLPNLEILDIAYNNFLKFPEIICNF